MLQILPTNTCYGLAGEFTEQDYLEIYRLKGRDFSKPLALLVEDFEDMKTYIDISPEQIEFLKNYPHPWSFLGKRIYPLPEWMDAENYQMLSLRIARVCVPKIRNQNILSLQYPLFLTSANLSGQPESKTLIEAQTQFPGVFGYDGGVCDRPPSDVFTLGEDGELQYVRKNYAQ